MPFYPKCTLIKSSLLGNLTQYFQFKLDIDSNLLIILRQSLLKQINYESFTLLMLLTSLQSSGITRFESYPNKMSIYVILQCKRIIFFSFSYFQFSLFIIGHFCINIFYP